MTRTIEREEYLRQGRAAADDLTWLAVEELWEDPFSYADVIRRVNEGLAELGFDSNLINYGSESVRIVRELVEVGLVARVRAWSPPSSPHLFRRAAQ